MFGYCRGGVVREGRNLLDLAAVVAEGNSEYKLEDANAIGKSVETLKREFCEIEFEIDVLKIERSPAVCKGVSKRKLRMNSYTEIEGKDP